MTFLPSQPPVSHLPYLSHAFCTTSPISTSHLADLLLKMTHDSCSCWWFVHTTFTRPYLVCIGGGQLVDRPHPQMGDGWTMDWTLGAQWVCLVVPHPTDPTQPRPGPVAPAPTAQVGHLVVVVLPLMVVAHYVAPFTHCPRFS